MGDVKLQLASERSATARKLSKRIRKTLAGSMASDVAEALLMEYCECLLAASPSYEAYVNNISSGYVMLEANGRHWFKANNS